MEFRRINIEPRAEFSFAFLAYWLQLAYVWSSKDDVWYFTSDQETEFFFFFKGRCYWIWPHSFLSHFCLPSGSIHRCINKILNRSLPWNLSLWSWWKGLILGGVGDYSHNAQAKPAKNLMSKKMPFLLLLLFVCKGLILRPCVILFCFVLITRKWEVPVLYKIFLGF